MADRVFLGVDIGAESGRVMAGLWDGRRLALEEVHRFPNGPVAVADSLRWDVLRLWADVRTGLTAAAARYGPAVASVGVDTWGVDFALLSKSGELLGQPFHYRDRRTEGVAEAAFARVPRAEVFAATGIQFLPFNTVYQLLALQRASPELLAAADRLLLVPDFLHWCLCGSTAVEFTNATTTQMVNPATRDWDRGLLARLGLPTHMLPEIVPPGANLGAVRASVLRETGLPAIPVVAPPSHDTAAAVAAIPTANTGRPDWAYISSGTWSLVGVEVAEAVVSARALEHNVTNEGGVGQTYRLLKNVMGLWLLQRCKAAFDAAGQVFGYDEWVASAERAEPFRSLIDPDDPRFLNPPDMPAAVREACRETGQPVPESPGQLARCVLESLALKYRLVVGVLEELTGVRVQVVHVVGGGSRNRLLNQFTADACGVPVVAGPVEATAVGNILTQVRAAGELDTLADMRRVVAEFAQPVEYPPGPSDVWLQAAERLRRLTAAR